MAIGLTPKNDVCSKNLDRFKKELDAKLLKVRGKDSNSAIKALKVAKDILDDYESMGIDLLAVDINNKTFSLDSFVISGDCGVAWQWKEV